MKKIGKFNLIKEHICTLHCDCGWNLHIGGRNKKDLEKIKKYLKIWCKMKCKDCNKRAKYEMKTPFATTHRCKIHIKKWETNPFVVITKLK